jgi:hypothetical protein
MNVITRGAFALLLALFASACGEGTSIADVSNEATSDPAAEPADPGTPVPQATRIQILLTDAPVDYIGEALVDIGRVTLVGGDGGPIVLSEDGTDGFVNLLDFQNAATMPLAEADIEPGTYSQLRLVVEAARVTMAEGYTFRDGSTEMELKVPSGAQTGIKLNLQDAEDGGPVEIVPGETVLVLDFDVNRSFVLRGNPETPAGVNGVNFKPTIRVAAMDVAASISGTVTPTEEGGSVEGLTMVATPTDEGSVEGYQTMEGTALTDADGTYTIYFLVPGSYDVMVEVSEGFEATPDMVSVTLGNSENATGVDFELNDLRGSLAGTVTPTADGLSVEGLTVSATTGEEDAESYMAMTGADGTYIFAALLPGTYTVMVEVAEGLATNPASVEVGVALSEDVTGVDFELLDVTGSIAGTVSTTVDGVSTGDLTVWATPSVEGAEPLTVMTESDGSYLFERVVAGTYVVSVEVGEDLLTEPGDVEVEVGAEEDVADVDFTVVEDLSGSITGELSTTVDGVSLAGLTVTATPAADGAEPLAATTNAAGEYAFESVPAGEYTITVEVGTGLTTDPESRVVTVEENEDEMDANFAVIASG